MFSDIWRKGRIFNFWSLSHSLDTVTISEISNKNIHIGNMADFVSSSEKYLKLMLFLINSYGVQVNNIFIPDKDPSLLIKRILCNPLPKRAKAKKKPSPPQEKSTYKPTSSQFSIINNRDCEILSQQQQQPHLAASERHSSVSSSTPLDSSIGGRSPPPPFEDLAQEVLSPSRMARNRVVVIVVSSLSARGNVGEKSRPIDLEIISAVSSRPERACTNTETSVFAS